MAEVILVEAADTFTHVAVRGKLDAAGVSAADLPLTGHTVARRKPAIIDLTEVGFLASLGIGMPATIARAMRGHGLRIAVVAASPVVHETLEMTNLGPLVPVVATREAALQALGVA